MKKTLQLTLLLSAFALCPIAALYGETEIIATPLLLTDEATLDAVTTEDADEDDQDLEDENDEDSEENQIIEEGHILNFVIAPEAIIDLDQITIVAEKNQFYFVINTPEKRIVTIGKTDDTSITLYTITIANGQSEDKIDEAEINASRITFPLDGAVDCEKMQAEFNKETRDLMLFIPFAS